MAQKKVGELIKEARTKKGLSQEKLAGMIDGLSASELSKAERGEKDLTQEELKAIAKICGVTQKSLLEAAGYASSSKKTTSTTKSSTSTAKSSTSAAKSTTSTAKKTSTASTAKKTSDSSTTKKTASSSDAVKLTATEKRILELYRAADAETKKNAEAVLKGTKQVQQDGGGLVGSLLGGALEALTGLGK